MHQFYPLTMEASEGDALEREDRPHYYSDDHLWIVLAVCAYLKETGDFAFLDEVDPVLRQRQRRAGPRIRHGARSPAARRSSSRATMSARTVCRWLGFADWNDTINLRTGAESLFTANLYGKALRELIELADFEHDTAAAEHFHRLLRRDEAARQRTRLGWRVVRALFRLRRAAARLAAATQPGRCLPTGSPGR